MFVAEIWNDYMLVIRKLLTFCFLNGCLALFLYQIVSVTKSIICHLFFIFLHGNYIILQRFVTCSSLASCIKREFLFKTLFAPPPPPLEKYSKQILYILGNICV